MPYRILIADDSDAIRDVLREALIDEGYDVSEAASGDEVLAEFNGSEDPKPDLVLMDLNMTKVDGLQATAAIRTMKQHPRQLPIIAMTAFPEMFSEEKAFEAGCDGYLQKPVHFDDLAKLFNQFLPTVPTA